MRLWIRDMVEKKPVNVKLQMIFSVIPFLDLYASYRIQKFRIWVLIFWVAGTIVGIIHTHVVYGADFFGLNNDIDVFADPFYAANYVLFVIIFAAAQAIVMRKFSKKWNSSFREENKIPR